MVPVTADFAARFYEEMAAQQKAELEALTGRTGLPSLLSVLAHSDYAMGLEDGGTPLGVLGIKDCGDCARFWWMATPECKRRPRYTMEGNKRAFDFLKERFPAIRGAIDERYPETLKLAVKWLGFKASDPVDIAGIRMIPVEWTR